MVRNLEDESRVGSLQVLFSRVLSFVIQFLRKWYSKHGGFSIQISGC